MVDEETYEGLGFECPVARKLVDEITSFSGGQLTIHKGNAPTVHAEFGMEGRASVYIDEHHAHVYLNRMLNEATLVHELLHVKSAWVLENPMITADTRLPANIRGYYSTISTALDHIYVLREQKKLGFRIPIEFKGDHENIVDRIECAKDLIDIKAYGGLAYLYLDKGLVKHQMLLKRLSAFLCTVNLLDWAQDFSSELWLQKNNMREMAMICFRHGLFNNNESAMVVRDIRNEQILIERFQ